MLGLRLPNLPNLPDLPNGANLSNVATDLLDAADKHVPTLSVNARRKFFHALAVVMFVPGIAVDVRHCSSSLPSSPFFPFLCLLHFLGDLCVVSWSGRTADGDYVYVLLQAAFTHLAFSGAFALFTFTEYVRYFALYPFGAMVHLFMNEFLDSKDSGTAILSHFYLLTGCANSVWFEG